MAKYDEKFKLEVVRRKALAILLRTRLTELSRRLGTRPPVYVLLSKIDQLEGFDAFFSRLPRTTREDILGFTSYARTS